MIRPRTKLVAIHPVHGYPIPPPQDVKVSRRNARERNRVKTVNDGFEKLKRSIPAAAAVKKISKVSILSHAVDYIQALQLLLEENPTTSNHSGADSSTFSPRPIHHHHHHHSPHPTPHHPGLDISPSYPPPLTPMSPNTCYYPPQQPAYTCPVPAYRYYESGYETPGIYSETEPELPPDYKDLVAKSLPSSGLTEGRLKKEAVEDEEESSGEEDDILDAIAEWQENEH